MQLRSSYRRRRTLTVCLAGLVALVACGTASAQDPEDPTNPFTQDEPIFPPTPYVSPLGNVYVSTDMVGFTRRDATGAYAVSNFVTIAMSGDDLEFGLQPGMRILGGVRLTDSLAVETSFLGFFEWDEKAFVHNQQTNIFSTPGNLFSPFTGFGIPPVLGLDYNDFVSVATAMEFDTGELNVRRFIDLESSGYQAAGIAGLRYVGLSDRFAYRSHSNVPAPTGFEASYDVATNNRMFGAQLGGAVEMHIERRAWLNLEAKGLILSNNSSQASLFTSGPAGAPATTVATGEASQRRVTLGVDFQATLSWRFSPAIVGRLGYQAIYLDGLALGEHNLQHNARNATTSPSELSNDGNMTFHGPFTGLTITW